MYMYIDLDTPIFLLNSKDKENEKFGTGFMISNDKEGTYILTCAHVVRDLGGVDKVKIGNHSVTVIAQSPDDYADDLAVLKVQGLSRDDSQDNLPLPLGISGKKGSTFMTGGFWLYDKRNEEYRLEQFKGFLKKRVKVKHKRQPDPVDAWALEIKDEDGLKAGFSGSPVIDTKNCFIIGIITHRESQGKSGQAISVKVLANTWPEMPSLLLRETTYNLTAISELLKNIFYDEKDLSSYCLDHFDFDKFKPNMPFAQRIEFFLDFCHKSNLIEKLLNHLSEFNKLVYKKFSSAITKEDFY
jgi:hypothetical protein